MLNFNDLQPVVRDTYSFVGIAKEGDDLLLHLPKGFDASTVSTYDQKRDLFFMLYRILRQFKSICVEKSYLKPDHLGMKTPDRDGVLKGEDGKAIATVPNEDDPLIFYGKLDWMGALLNANDELKIAALVYRLGRTEKVDYSQLHRFMHQGVFLSNGNIYIDTMTLPRPQVQFESTDIVAMYCYLLEAVSVQLGDVVSPEVTALGERFRERYLGIEASLFNEQDYGLVLNELKDALDTIDRHTSLKDEDYYTFYEAIERFLYGRWQSADEGEIWGINNFHMVWESMCLTYLAKTVSSESLLWLDRQFVPNAVLQAIDTASKWLDLSSTFNCNGKELRPDAVVFSALALSEDAGKVYFLRQRAWDDYGYWTTFSIDLGNIDEIKVGYIDQPGHDHSFNELKKVCKVQGSALVIDRPLPARFYSYWSVDSGDSAVQWTALKYFNHIYWAALQQGVRSPEGIKEYLEKSLGVKHSSRNTPNVIELSLLRFTDWNSIQEEFRDFLQQVLQFQIIDVKYNDVAYFQNEANRQAIKARSVRKQFVYEYLLQQSIEPTVEKNAPIHIDSAFWVPQVSTEPTVLGDRIPYLGLAEEV